MKRRRVRHSLYSLIRMPRTNSRSNLQFFRYLPSEIVTDILSRLPIRTIVICKCVCRSWRDLIRSREFADFHFPKSVPGVVFGDGWFTFGPDGVEVYEFDDELGLEQHDLHYKLLVKIDSMEFLRKSELHGSANGLVLLHREVSGERDALYVCNPITREYIELLYDRLAPSSSSVFTVFTYGFGVSRITGKYKVVRILICHDGGLGGARTLQNVTMSICLVYTLGTGIWRNIALPAPFLSVEDSIGVSMNGNLHWLVQVSDDSHCILRFDLETETFSTLSVPSPLSDRVYVEPPVSGLVVLGDCLCVSDNTFDDEVLIWLMKEYGVLKSWTKEFVMTKVPGEFEGDIVDGAIVHPIKVFKDGDILMVVKNIYMFYYDKKNESIEESKLFGYHDQLIDDLRAMKATTHTPSFLPLSHFVSERVGRC